jgi:FAD/FMN-containing dehydrogenase
LLSDKVLTRAARIVGDSNIGPGDDYFRGNGQSPSLKAAKAGSPEEIQDLVSLAAEQGFSIYTVRGRFAPSSIRNMDGLLLDLSRMDGIIELDARNMKARIEAGVTYEQLSEAVEPEGLQVLLPISATSRSVLRSNIDRDVLLGGSSFRKSSISVFKAVLGNGEVWGSGTQQLGSEGRPDFGEDQGPQLSGAFSASEDVFGIPFQCTVYLYPKYEDRKVLLFGFAERQGALDFIKTVARREHCFQCAGADPAYWGALTGRDGLSCVENTELFSHWPWSVVLSLEHVKKLVDFLDGAVHEEASSFGGEPIDGAPRELAAAALDEPWYRWDYDTMSGDSHVVDYFCYPRSAGEFFDTAGKAIGTPDGVALGHVVVPVSFGGSMFCETVLYTRPEDFRKAKEPALAAYRAVFEKGAVIDRPTGDLAAWMFQQADPGYNRVLRILKKQLDPCGVLNPGALLKDF